jgi:hypothetical protein
MPIIGCEDALLHLLNYVWPNLFEESAHVIAAVMEAIEAMMIAGEKENAYTSSIHRIVTILPVALSLSMFI